MEIFVTVASTISLVVSLGVLVAVRILVSQINEAISYAAKVWSELDE